MSIEQVKFGAFRKVPYCHECKWFYVPPRHIAPPIDYSCCPNCGGDTKFTVGRYKFTEVTKGWFIKETRIKDIVGFDLKKD